MTSSIPCGGCGCPASDLVGTIPFYLPDGDIETTLWRCSECGTYTRDIDLDDPTMRRHFDIASYTDPAIESRYRAVRQGYFVYLSRLFATHLQRSLTNVRVLDVGTAYGHFLDRLVEDGATVEGVEIVAALRKSAAERGLTVHEGIPTGTAASFDAVAVIDSLYYTDDPLTTLQQIRGILAPGGLLLLRVTNRTWLFDLMRFAGFGIECERFGDSKYNFSPEGTLRVLARAGYRVEEVISKEEGKADPRWLIRLYYRVAPLLSKYLSLRVAPGMIVVARVAK